MIQMIIAEDHAIVRGGLKRIFALESDISVVGEAVNGAEVLDWLQHDTINLILLDMNMPGISGADLITRIRTHRPDLAILVLSMHNVPQIAAMALRAGASGYITKDCEPDMLLDAMRKVTTGGSYIAPDLAQRMVFDVTSSAPRLPHTQLTERELEIFLMLSRGMAVNEIATQLTLSSKTVSTHKARMMEKMNLSHLADLMRYAITHELL
jgi:DNA-binding NarL/FixJ family response regulator